MEENQKRIELLEDQVNQLRDIVNELRERIFRIENIAMTNQSAFGFDRTWKGNVVIAKPKAPTGTSGRPLPTPTEIFCKGE